MSLLEEVYASAPTEYVIINTLEIKHPSITPIRVCDGYDDQTVTLEDDSEVTFRAGGIDIALPAKNTSGQQELTFAISNVTGEAQAAIDAILEAGGQATITYRPYLSTDLAAPAEPPIVLTISGGTFQGGQLQVTAAYYDLLNTRWPRKLYTAEFAPGLKYIS